MHNNVDRLTGELGPPDEVEAWLVEHLRGAGVLAAMEREVPS